MSNLSRALLPKGRELSRLKIFLTVLLFLSSSALAWLVCNHFDIAREEGFDPLRYEYFAVYGLPEYLQGSTSYNIVEFLVFVYRFLPVYFGFLFANMLFVWSILVLDKCGRVTSAVISPIAFFYIAQTGKDGIAILSIACVALIAVYKHKWKATNFFLLLIVVISIYIRPPLILFLPPIYVLFRWGVYRAIWVVFILALIFLFANDSTGIMATLESVVSDEGSGPMVQLGRQLTFGYSVLPILVRISLLFISPFLQPFISVVKFHNSADWLFIFEGCTQFWFLMLLLKKRIVKTFLINSLPFVILVGVVSPFYHFRYIAILYPAIFACSLLSLRHNY